MKDGFIVFRNLICVLAAAVLCGFLSLTLIYMLPLNEDSVTVRQSEEILASEGWYPVFPYMEAFANFGEYTDEPGRLDNFTDEIMISSASNRVDENWAYHAMDVKGYSYYWHGYVLLLRPLLFLLNYGEIRKLNALLQMFLVGILALLLYKRKGALWSFWAVTIYALLVPAALGMSLQFSWVFYIGMIGTVVLLHKENFLKQNFRICYLFLLLGILTSFFDLLTYPLFTWGIPMVVWLALDERTGEGHRLKEVVICGLCWILGYAGMWSGKCLLANLVLHRDVIGSAISEVTYRSGMGMEDGTVSYLSVLLGNIRKMIGVQGLMLSLGWAACFAVRLIKCGGRVALDKCLSFTLVAFSSFVWYYVLRQHTDIHQWFTYRIYAVFFGALLVALISSVEPGNVTIHAARRPAMKCALAGVVILAFWASLQYKTEWWYHNGNYAANRIALEEGAWVEESILPRHDEIYGVNLGIGAEGDKGEFLIEFYGADNLIYEKTVPAAELEGAGFYELPVKFRTKGQEIRMRISVSGCEESAAYVLVTQGEMPLTECSELSLNGEALGGQMIQGITYWWFYGKKECANFFFVCAGALLLLLYDVLYEINMMNGRLSAKKRQNGKNL